MMIGQAVLTTIFTQTHLIAIFRETYTTIYATMTIIGQAFLTTIGAVLPGIVGLQVGLMIGEVVRGIAGAVPVGIVKFGL
jgi:outer membrane lipoprotein SlyB